MGFWNAGTIAAVGGAGAGIAGSAISAASAAKQNKKQMRFARDMYNLEKEDALAQWNRENEYGEAMWHKMNSYNSPMAQMDRYKEAGLNPNLIYGQSNTAPAIATANFDRPRHSNVDIKAVDFGGAASAVGRGLMNYVAFREAGARTDNIAAQTEIAKQDAILRSNQNTSVSLDNAKKSEELPYAKDQAYANLANSLQANEKLVQDMQLAERRDQRETSSNAAYLGESAERILASRGQRVSVALDATLKEIDIRLKKRGINPNDPMYLRIIGQVLSGTVDDMERKSKNFLNKLNSGR